MVFHDKALSRTSNEPYSLEYPKIVSVNGFNNSSSS